MPPIAAISATADATRVRLSLNYVRSTEGAGLTPLVVPPYADASRAASVLDAAAGLLLTGGEDVDPRLYGAVPHPTTQAPNPARDETELALLRLARERRIPVLAICRGIQLVNVAFGGTLVQDLPSERPSAIVHDQGEERSRRSHAVTLAADSLVASAAGSTAFDVNSYHHQAVDRLGTGLRVTGRAPDGVVEACEGTEAGWWLLAVQWHPEDLTTDAPGWDRGLFRAWADQVRAFCATR
ncbi:MAG: gamma-glutamyl-gamma-aminobutyrate hydrolase family protein [Gemmatimonadetes bacterium]|nr:gamma-glutamyl-gamma-aminobutyrate hydrolase family protein [Gemmatimonadota bacterium]